MKSPAGDEKSFPSLQRRSSGAVLAALLALAFLVLSLLPLTGDGFWKQVAEPAIESALTEPLWRTRLGLNLMIFAAVVLLLHLGYATLVWSLALVSERAWPGTRVPRWQWVLIWFLAIGSWLMLANAAQFPDSALGVSLHQRASRRLLGTTVHTLLGLLTWGGALLTIAVASARSMNRRGMLLAAAALSAITTVIVFAVRASPSASASSRMANVILLGIDSLRPDLIDPQRTPHVREFLADAVQLTDTITPLARTFPAWASILTGRAPHVTGAYMNLLPRDRIQTGDTLPAEFRRKGYRTIYAIDETRFSNIDQSYDFDQIVTPAMGATDFVLSSFADTPLSNLLVNTTMGAWLFPHLHANRAAHVLYDPDTFVRRLDRELRFDRPLFLAAHLTLPHWPYTWANSTFEQASSGPGTEAGPREAYLSAVKRADRQFGDVLAMLRRRGALDNALVVVLSDHGEALRSDGDLLSGYLPEKARGAAGFQNQGHGSSVLSPPQYRVVLAFRAFGSAGDLLPPRGEVDVPASLMDIAPTVLELLAIPSSARFDGLSLAPALRAGGGAMPELAQRVRFTETEFSPRNLSPENPTGSALAEAVSVFQVDPRTDRLSVRIQKLDQIMGNRQYAALLGNRALAAALPDLRADGQHELVIVPDPFMPAAQAPTPDTVTGVSGLEVERLRQALQDNFNIRVAAPEHLATGS